MTGSPCVEWKPGITRNFWLSAVFCPRRSILSAIHKTSRFPNCCGGWNVSNRTNRTSNRWRNNGKTNILFNDSADERLRNRQHLLSGGGGRARGRADRQRNLGRPF